MALRWFTPAGLHTSSAQLPVEGRLPSFDGATEWLNSPPLTTAGLGGKVAIQTGGAVIEGSFETIDEAGCLIVRTVDGKRIPVTAGDVYFGEAASAGTD